MKEQFTIYTAKNGSKYIQTENKYLAHGLAFCGYRFMMFDKVFSFHYSEELLQLIQTMLQLKENTSKNMDVHKM